MYPSTPKKELTETIHGYRIVDNYRWLENSEDATVKKWITAQNGLTDEIIPKKPRLLLENKLQRSYYFPTINVPFPCGDLYFWRERQPEQDQNVLCVRKGLRGKKRILVDPNQLTKNSDHIISLDYWSQSPNGKLVAFGISQDGDELSTIKILNVSTGKDVETIADNAPWASIQWLPDSSGFFYTKGPKLGSVPKGDERWFNKVYYHQLGNNPDLDKLIFGKGRPKEDLLQLELSIDGKLLVISASQNWVRNDLFLYEVDSGKITDLIVGYDAKFGLLFMGSKAILWTDYHAPNGCLLSAELNNLPHDPNEWSRFIPERKDALEWFHITKDQILCIYLINAMEKVVTFDQKGKETGLLPMPKYASLLSIGSRREESQFFYDFASFITPGTIYRYTPETHSTAEYYHVGSTLNENDYVIKQEWFKSKDGTKVPMFIVHRKNLKLDGKNPTILYGYGGFASSGTPGFLRAYTPWLEKGGVYASANIRGGGEFGKEWHLGAIKENKQRSYDDFIAAAEHLISKKYTDNQHLGILGGSNGGLLVSAVAVQRQELFRAVVAQVPLTDMVRFPNLLIAARWTSEYGDPTKAKDLKNILKFSPYHNVKVGTEYPAFLFTTSDNDTRVDPMHARKMAALLQNTNSHHPILLFTDKSAGHMGAQSMSRFYKNHARILAFLADNLRLRH
jgi:prolyl oligopeptidase